MFRAYSYLLVYQFISQVVNLSKFIHLKSIQHKIILTLHIRPAQLDVCTVHIYMLFIISRGNNICRSATSVIAAIVCFSLLATALETFCVSLGVRWQLFLAFLPPLAPIPLPLTHPTPVNTACILSFHVSIP